MPGKPDKLATSLFDDGSLLGFLQSTLEAMEAAAGGQLSEERAKLQELQMALGGLAMSPPQPVEADDLALAGHLDKLEQQLTAVEQRIATADNGTRQLLTQSTVVWAGAGAQQECSSAPSDSLSSVPSTSCGANTPQHQTAQAKSTTPAVAGNDCDAVQHTTSSGLMSVTEAANEGEDTDD